MRRYPRFCERQGTHMRYLKLVAAATNNKQPNSNQQSKQPKQPTTKINAQNKHTTPTPVIPCEVSCSETRWIPYYGGSDREGSC